MNYKSLATLTAAAALAFFTSACSDDPKTENPTGGNDTPILPDNPTGGDSTVTDPTGGDDPTVGGDSTSTEPIVVEPFTPKGILIDDFEDGDGETAQGNGWFTYDDQGNKGASVIETAVSEEGYPVAVEGGYNSKYGFQVNYTLDKGDYPYDPYVAIGVAISEEDFSKIGGIHYCYKGGKHTVRVETSDVTDFDVHGTQMPASTAAWKCVDVKFRDLAQEGWGVYVPFNKENINQISFHIKGTAKVSTGSLIIDNVAFLDQDALPADVADLTINEPSIPEVTIGDIAISNPLQEKAMKYLNKGVNFTNWLEEANGKFDGTFEFGEDDIKLLAGYGFKSIRLPIDLDLYVTNKKDFLAGKATELAFDDETLFKVLDSFDTWTKENGMSFVIDYHEYDNSYNATSANDTIYIKMMAGVWKHVAEHFATSEREDIFFELLNEPDMSNGKVTAAQWTVAAQAMIDAIREVDKKHSILFGDAQWYSMTLLAKRTPFTDDNIIYVIHTYEPFVFTHQGGSWTDYAAVKNIPFPYDPAKWSEYSVDFGVSAANKSKVLGAIKQYYKTGSKEAILQAVAKAKAWAVTNNVPVIINEFGALRDKSDAESVLNYYKAMAEICDTLQIPWTHWGYTGGFSVIDKDGKLYDGLAEAMGLEAK